MSYTKKLLVSKLQGKLPRELLNLLPSRYPILGNVLLIRLRRELLKFKILIGNTLLEIFPHIKGVWGIIDTVGVTRRPVTQFLAGDPNPIIIHKELNTLFMFDISKITFSPGNTYERKRLLKLVKRDDVILDLFSCVGNLSLPLVTNKKARLVIGFEINPYAFYFLQQNIILNKVINKYIGIYGNNYFALEATEIKADHVLLGYLPEPTLRQLKVAISLLRRKGFIHYHTLAPKGNYNELLKQVLYRIHNLGAKVEKYLIDFVKSFSPRYDHIVFRFIVKKRE